MKKIGLYGGSFDPPHFGHINLAIEIMEKRGLDEVWFIPAQINPLKIDIPPISIVHRLEMVKLAIESIPHFYLKDVEKDQPAPSYTINTVKNFIEKEAEHSKNHFFLLLGEDSVPGFLHWRAPGEIVRLAPLLIGSRSGMWQYELHNFDLPIREAIQEGLTPTRLMDISSSEIRDKIRQKKYCGHLVPLPVLNYIEKNLLYSSNVMC